jgi:hypothetical protein
MAFERIQRQTHIIADTKVSASYDRFTTRFEIKNEKEIIYSSLLLFVPIRNAKISINKQDFTFKIIWIILWQSKLFSNNDVVVKELIPSRRRKSIGLLI